ncbi:MAG: isoprenylcysteine carboxylmethyltransferase family protein [Candidatus Rokubacteria bacterium]|nr:isoprenylcysteine carboxylmethyltransferase family protein [Candidatus Rokubacteria bacterium]
MKATIPTEQAQGRDQRADAGAGRRLAARGAIVLSFVVALEIVIMISPFALFFYAVFNPVLLALDRSPATRWLTAFFLPHMVISPDPALSAIRVVGSVAFMVGAAVFFACAVQVYAGKLLRTGPATRGLYAVIRHPQYLALAVSGFGLAILWPRFLTLVLLAVMLFLYYLLARDEERRMLARFGDGYRAFMERTGMFFPRLAGSRPPRPASPRHLTVGRGLAILVALLVIGVGAGFGARAYTVRHLPLGSVGPVDVIAVTPEDLTAAREVLPEVLKEPAVAAKLAGSRDQPGRVLAYFVPIDYTMQGMIADTGEEWKLFARHATIPMITDFVLHPVAHLVEGHGHPGATGHGFAMHESPTLKRRVIFVDVSARGRTLASPVDDFRIAVTRRPLFFIDVHLHTGEVLAIRDTPPGSGWGTVPTPVF